MPEQAVEPRYSEEVNEIITAVPSWILKRGIALILLILLLIILLSAFIRYPDVIKTTLRINSLNAPKGVITHQGGKIVTLLVNDKQPIKSGEAMAFIESTANHYDVIKLNNELKKLRNQLISQPQAPIKMLTTNRLNLGELQNAYQSFYQEFLNYQSTQDGGLYQVQKTYLQKDLQEINKLKIQINKQQQVQKLEYANAEQEYEAYKKLKAKNVISNSEFKQQENKYLASKYPLQQSETALLTNSSSHMAKQKELATLENTIAEQQAKFAQALNSVINETESWLLKYVITAPMDGKVGYAGILQENQNVTTGQELFIVNPGNTNFFGEVQIPQYNMGKIKLGQRALVKLRSYPFEEFGMLTGKISYITDVAVKDSVFIAKIDFSTIKQKDPAHPIVLKTGMTADAEIITRESSLLQRFLYGITKVLNDGN